jgi:hypothetical protein
VHCDISAESNRSWDHENWLVITFDSVDLIFFLNQPFVLYRMVLQYYLIQKYCFMWLLVLQKKKFFLLLIVLQKRLAGRYAGFCY